MKMQSVLASKGPNVVTIEPEATVRQAVVRLAHHNIGALVVVDSRGLPIGIVSERDIVQAASADKNILDSFVQSVMTGAVICGAPDDDVESVLLTMTLRRIRHLPIVENDQLVGIVSIRDLVSVELNNTQGEVDNLRMQIMNS